MLPVDKERQAVLVGVGRFTQRPQPVEQCYTPVGMVRAAAALAETDAGLVGILPDLVGIGTPEMFLENRWRAAFGEKQFRNFSRSCASALGASPAREHCIVSKAGGNSPQYLVSLFADLIAKGAIPQGPILIAGAEENATFDRAVRAGRKEVLNELHWSDGDLPPADKATLVNDHMRPTGPRAKLMTQIVVAQVAVGSLTPLTAYPMLENAYAHERHGRSAAQHLPYIAELFSRFSVVAAAHPEHSWWPEERSAAFLAEVTSDNRIIGFPYRKWMCARDEIDQSAAVIVMSWAEAERRGVARSKLVFLWGSGDGFDSNAVPLRRSLGRCPAMKAAYDEAFRSAGIGPDAAAAGGKVALFDFYSCFPVAVEQACDCVGLDPSTTPVNRLTQTGGLPYHGGPGSNYSLHGMAAMVEHLRLEVYRGKLGVVGANGGSLTEHSVGVYSTAPPARTYARRPHAEYAADCTLPPEAFALRPNGRGRVLTWTVVYKRRPNVPERGYVIGEMVSGPDIGKRFLATAVGEETLGWLLGADPIGAEMSVSCDGKEGKFGQYPTFNVVASREQAAL